MALQLVVGVATVLVLYRVAALLVGRGTALAVGVAAAVWPTSIYWTRYIETETLFLFLLSCFLLVCTRQLVAPSTSWKRWSSLAVSAAGVVACRSVGIFIVWAGLIVLGAAAIRRRRGAASACRAALVVVAGSILAVIAVLSLPGTRDEVLGLRNVSDSLWSSTRAFHADLEHAQRRTSLPGDIRSLPDGERDRELSHRALRFIREHPGDYATRAGVRFTNFWFPWLTADWSAGHLVLDALLSLGLVTLALGAVVVVPGGPRRQVLVLLVAVVAVQALAVTFGELDSDGRYRVPVELCLLLMAGMTIDAVLARRREALHSAIEPAVASTAHSGTVN
jgi:hypothetical protein